jgi:drug/metabolite transporter (DMT)-like permease
MLLATISIAVPLIALFPMAMLAAGAFFLREALSLAIILSAALILVDVRILKARAASFVRFTTNDTQSVFYNDSHRSVDITAAIALIGALYMLLGGARSSIVVFAYALMILGWLGMRGKAAVAVRKQISRAADHGPAEGDEPTSPRIA